MTDTVTGRDLDARVAEVVFGWQWWAHTKAERDDPHGPRVERVVRTLHAPDFQPGPWEEWAAHTGKVFRPATGDEPVERVQGMGDAVRQSLVPPYSSDMSAAWLVVDEMRRRDWILNLRVGPSGKAEVAFADDGEERPVARHVAKSPALAICRAALAALAR